MIQLVVFVPEAYKEKVKNAMFDVGGGKIGNYDSCCFENPGVGQFRPLKGSDAFLGEVGRPEFVNEARIELSCEDNIFPDVVQAMLAAHPYEMPAYYGIKTVSLSALN